MDTTKGNSSNKNNNPDAITGAPGSHPVATGVGAAAAGAAGAAIGSIVPGVGTAIGAVAGAIIGSVGGGYAGHVVGESVDPSADTDTYWKSQHTTRDYVQKGASYDQYRPAYQYGAQLADTSTDTAFDESKARTDWESKYANTGLKFDDAKGAIQDEFNRRIQLREERLNVGKERVATGEVGIRKEITTERKTVEVPLEREEVVITRRAVSGSTADGGTIQDEEIRIPVSEEQARVSKETVVTGEVEIGKRVVTEKKTFSDDVRKENIKVDNASNVKVDDRTQSN